MHAGQLILYQTTATPTNKLLNFQKTMHVIIMHNYSHDHVKNRVEELSKWFHQNSWEICEYHLYL